MWLDEQTGAWQELSGGRSGSRRGPLKSKLTRRRTPRSSSILRMESPSTELRAQVRAKHGGEGAFTSNIITLRTVPSTEEPDCLQALRRRQSPIARGVIT
jgi:hypothetical protein